MWYRMMTIAFIANGLCAFGARVLEDMGLAATHFSLYLAFWYSAGLAISLCALLARSPRIVRAGYLIGGAMGLFSSLGWVFITLSIARGVPGYLVFPIAIGGNLAIVAAVGVLIFRERLSLYGYFGILSGVACIVLLAVS